MPSLSGNICSRPSANNFFLRRLLDLVSDLDSDAGFDFELGLMSVVWLTIADRYSASTIISLSSRAEVLDNPIWTPGLTQPSVLLARSLPVLESAR
jgi:hypothetical protein